MKKLFFSIRRAILLLALFAFCQSALLAQCSFPPKCKGVTVQSIVINVPKYTNKLCDVLVTYKQIVCSGSYNVYDFVYLPLGNCGDFAKRIVSDAQFAKDLDVIAGRQIADFIAKQAIFNSGGNSNDYTCNGTASKFVGVSYYRGSCISIWEGQTTVEVSIPGTIKIIKNTGPGTFPFETTQLSFLINQTVFGTVPCGYGCCKLNRNYCIENGVLTATESTESANPSGNICSFISPPPPSGFDYGNVTWIQASPCFTICDNIPPKGKVVSNITRLTDDNSMFFKNPIDGNLIVNFTEEVIGFIDIQDMNGRLERRVFINQDKSVDVDLFNLSNGMYYVVLQHKDGRVETQRLVKQ